MATTDERLRILKMIEQGQISAEDGARLLEALSSPSSRAWSAPYTTPSSGSARWLRRVTDMTTGKHKVERQHPHGTGQRRPQNGRRFARQRWKGSTLTS